MMTAARINKLARFDKYTPLAAATSPSTGPGSVSNLTGLGKRARFAHRAPGAYVIAHSIDDVQAIGL